MRLVGLKTLKVGDVLAMPVCTSSGKTILNSGVTITETYIEKLKLMKIRKVYISDGRFDDVELSEELDFKLKNNAIQVLEDTHKNVRLSKEVDEYLIKDISKDIVEYVLNTRSKGISILSNDAVDDYIFEHSLNVALLSAYLGSSMNFNFNQLCDLVAGALIHDIGRENSSEEKVEHVQKGFDAMRKCRGMSLHSSIVCYEHHENFDGSGYPRKLKGNAISEFTRVIRAADVYDNILYGYEGEEGSLMPHQAFEYIMSVSGKILDPEIVQHFKNTIIFYPNGCTVLLNNGLKGVVIRQNPGSPQRPALRIYNDQNVIGELDLVKSLTVFVKDVLVI